MKNFGRANNSIEKLFKSLVITGSFFLLIEIFLFIIGCVVPEQIDLVTSIMEAIGIFLLIAGTILAFISKKMFFVLSKNKSEMLTYKICVDDIASFVQNISLGFRKEKYYSVQTDNELHEDVPMAFVKEEKLSKKILILIFSDELSDKALVKLNDFSIKVVSRFGKDTPLYITKIVCVNHASYYFTKFLEEQPDQTSNTCELLAGVVLHEKKLYLNSIVNGNGSLASTQLKKELLKIMGKTVL